MIKIIFTDMDGTLLDEKGQLPQEFGEVIRELRAHGVLFAPASGRQYFSLLDSFPEYEDEFVFIAENGTLVKYQGREIFSSPMPRELGLRVLHEGVEKGAGRAAVFCGKKTSYTLPQHNTPDVIAELHKFFTHNSIVESFDTVDDDIIKVSFFEQGHAADNIYPKLEHFKEDGLQVVLASPDWVDLILDTASKGTAIKAVQKLWGLDTKECAAFGDYMNDAEMMEAVHYSYAMANALPKIKELARFETKSNAEHGVMLAIKELIARGLCG